MSGRTILDMRRANAIELQSNISGFVDAFSALTGGLLKGIEWNNVFVAGGIVLGALLSTDLAKDVDKYKNSDIDLYIYGLGPVEANAKVAHIYEKWRSNLPKGAESRVLRNSRTITSVVRPVFFIIMLTPSSLVASYRAIRPSVFRLS